MGRNQERIMITRILCSMLTGLFFIWGATPARAQDNRWAERMFDEHEHDFGVVARGSDARYRMRITNRNAQTVHIADVTTTCGCTAGKTPTNTLAPQESTFVEIKMNTVKFEGDKPSSVTVAFDRPAHAEVRIPIHAFIRRDVVLTPGAADFGSITLGTEAEKTIDVAYAGRGNWTIRDVISKNSNVEAQVVETRRNGANVNYHLRVKVKPDAPAGAFREQLTLVTDEQSNPYIPVLVEGRVATEYTVTPEVVAFGTMAPGERKTVNIVVRGKRPFTIEKIESRESSDRFEVRLPKDEKAVHVVPLALTAPHEPGPVDEEFTVTIRDSGERLTFQAHGKVVAPGTAASRPRTATQARLNR
jgi:hypothetical protein